MNKLAHLLSSAPTLEDVPLARRLVPIVTGPTGLTSAGYPYLNPEGFARFRDTTPHILADGPRVVRALGHLVELADALEHDEVPAEERASFDRATRVLRAMVNTAAVTAPPDLWLLRHVLGVHAQLGLTTRLLAGEELDPSDCQTPAGRLDPEELDADLHFLASRGYLSFVRDRYRITSHPAARAVMTAAAPVPDPGVDPIDAWSRVFTGGEVTEREAGHLRTLARTARSEPRDAARDTWWASWDEIELGFRLVPVVLGLRVAELSRTLKDTVSAEVLSARHPELGQEAIRILAAAGILHGEAASALTSVGRRVLSRGPGPFGIIATYRPYMVQGVELLRKGAADVWVRRGANVAASQDANRATFRQANEALDSFCAETGFAPSVFIEHAMGRGEATRQRWLASPDLRFVGADLEDDSIDAAEQEQAQGQLPPDMLFVRKADIGKPSILLDALAAAGVPPRDAVMMVGNGFHEVRDQTDDKMIDVFRQYEQSGLVLLFTEAGALSVSDLLQTAFNTYNAGFQFVHAKSGQGLRPATPAPMPRFGRPQPLSWTECATAAGYARADHFCRKTRTIYPYPPPGGHNPSISVNHFFVPRELAKRLDVC